MALKTCRECGKEVSTQAVACPNCGAADPTGAKGSKAAIGCLGVILLGGVIALGIGFFVNDSGSSGGKHPSSASASGATESAPAMQSADLTVVNAAWKQVVSIQNRVNNARGELQAYLTKSLDSNNLEWAKKHSPEAAQAIQEIAEGSKEAESFKSIPLQDQEANKHFQAAIADFNAWGLWSAGNIGALMSGDLKSAALAARQMDATNSSAATDFLLTYEALGGNPPATSASSLQ